MKQKKPSKHNFEKKKIVFTIKRNNGNVRAVA